MQDDKTIKCPWCFEDENVKMKYSQKSRTITCSHCGQKYAVKFPWPVVTKIKPNTARKKLIKECDELYSELIKKRAGYKCEISGATKDSGAILQTHHIAHKPNIFMRYYIPNGICITKELHILDKLTLKTRKELEQMIMDVRGKSAYNQLSNAYMRSRDICLDLREIKKNLLSQIKEIDINKNNT